MDGSGYTAAKKHCSRCGEFKDRSEFNRSRQKPDGLQNQCRPCNSEANKEAYRRDTARWRARTAERTTRVRRENSAAVAAELKGRLCAACGDPSEDMVLVDEETDRSLLRQVHSWTWTPERAAPHIKQGSAYCRKCWNGRMFPGHKPKKPPSVWVAFSGALGGAVLVAVVLYEPSRCWRAPSGGPGGRPGRPRRHGSDHQAHAATRHSAWIPVGVRTPRGEDT